MKSIFVFFKLLLLDIKHFFIWPKIEGSDLLILEGFVFSVPCWGIWWKMKIFFLFLLFRNWNDISSNRIHEINKILHHWMKVNYSVDSKRQYLNSISRWIQLMNMTRLDITLFLHFYSSSYTLHTHSLPLSFNLKMK